MIATDASPPKKMKFKLGMALIHFSVCPGFNPFCVSCASQTNKELEIELVIKRDRGNTILICLRKKDFIFLQQNKNSLHRIIGKSDQLLRTWFPKCLYKVIHYVVADSRTKLFRHRFCVSRHTWTSCGLVVMLSC